MPVDGVNSTATYMPISGRGSTARYASSRQPFGVLGAILADLRNRAPDHTGWPLCQLHLTQLLTGLWRRQGLAHQ